MKDCNQLLLFHPIAACLGDSICGGCTGNIRNVKLQSKRSYFCPVSAGFCAIDGRESLKWVIAAVQNIQICSACGPPRAFSDPSVY